jgi:hypothetical protein
MFCGYQFFSVGVLPNNFVCLGTPAGGTNQGATKFDLTPNAEQDAEPNYDLTPGVGMQNTKSCIWGRLLMGKAQHAKRS